MKIPHATLQQQAPNSALLEISVDSKLQAFKGHFADTPIIPGVVQIEWALYFFKKYLNQDSSDFQVEQVSALKFQQVIQPNDVVLLSLDFNPEKQILAFAITNPQSKFSSGKIVLGQ